MPIGECRMRGDDL